MIRQEVFAFFSKRLRELNSTAIQIADLLDLNYRFLDREVSIDSEQISIAAEADRVVLVSEIEARYLRTKLDGKKINVLWAEYEPQPINLSWESSNGLIFVGGFRHLPNVEAVQWFSREVIPHLRRSGFSSPIRIIGSGLPHEVKIELQKNDFEILGMQDDLVKFYELSRIAIVPLQSGRGRKGKIGEALSFGIPIVTTSIGAEGFDFHEDDSILICDDPEQCANSISKVHDDYKLWSDMCAFGKMYCQKNLSSNAMNETIKSVIGVNNE